MTGQRSKDTHVKCKSENKWQWEERPSIGVPSIPSLLPFLFRPLATIRIRSDNRVMVMPYHRYNNVIRFDNNLIRIDNYKRRVEDRRKIRRYIHVKCRSEKRGNWGTRLLCAGPTNPSMLLLLFRLFLLQALLRPDADKR
jgi:hypothetical protein